MTNCSSRCSLNIARHTCRFTYVYIYSSGVCFGLSWLDYGALPQALHNWVNTVIYIYIYIGISSYHNLQLYPLRYARVFAYGCDCFYMVNRNADTGETREPQNTKTRSLLHEMCDFTNRSVQRKGGRLATYPIYDVRKEV